MDILIFTSGALKTWVLHVNTFYSWILLHIYRPWQPLTYLYFPYHCISLIYFSFTKIRMFLYAQIYWLAEFGDVSCLQFNYLRVETLTLILTPTWGDFVGQFYEIYKKYISKYLRCRKFDDWWSRYFRYRLKACQWFVITWN